MARRAKPRLTLKPSILKDLLSQEAVDSVLIQGVEGGFQILIGFGAEEQPLGLVREDRPRVFKTHRSAVNHFGKLGVTQDRFDMTRHSPAPKPATQRSKGPGRAAARERTAEAVAYDAWFRASVGEALAQVDDGTAELHEWDPVEGRREFEEMVARHRAKQTAKLTKKEKA